MTLPALATVADLEARLGAQVDNVEQASALLDDASGLIRLEVDPVTWVDEDGSLEAVPQVVVTICCKAVKRALANRDGLMQRSETIGSYTSAEMFHGTQPSDVYLTAAEKRLVRRAAGRKTVGTLLVSRETRRIRDEYLEVTGESEPFHVGIDGQ